MADHKDRKFDGKVYKFTSQGVPRIVLPQVAKLRQEGFPVRTVKSVHNYEDFQGRPQRINLLTVYVRWNDQKKKAQ
jgi:hypothetical protein